MFSEHQDLLCIGDASYFLARKIETECVCTSAEVVAVAIPGEKAL